MSRPRRSERSARPREVTRALLRAHPLPRLDAEGDKEARGRVLVVAGSREMPGAAALAAVGALRAGAGKLQIATTAEAVSAVAMLVPEARVFILRETRSGAPAASSFAEIARQLETANVVLVGPGMIGDSELKRFTERVRRAKSDARFVLDAEAMHSLRPGAIVTPHAGELAGLTGRPRAWIEARKAEVAREFARGERVVTVLKGAETIVATPDGETFRHWTRCPGLGTSGSGDTLAGIVAGLAAGGADPLAAALWGVAAHARAGERLSARIGRVGYLAREILDEVPAALRTLGRV